MTYSLFRNSKDEPWQLVERVPMGFDLMFNNSASIYTLSDTNFKNIKTGFAEVVSETSVDILKEERINNVYQKLEELQTSGLIKIYRYPDRPKNIPLDDYDLIEKELMQAQRRNKPITRENFERLLLLHPKLLKKVNSVASLKIKDFIPFKQEDLIDIFEKFILMQMIYPSKEQFIKPAFKEITKAYPEFLSVLQNKLKIFEKSKEEKITFLFNTISKSRKNIPQELVEKEKIKYLQDTRSFSVIGQEIINIGRKINMIEKIINKSINEDVLNNSVILIGPMGTGKSTVGKLLSNKLNIPRISLDNNEQLSNIYQQRDNFKNFKEFELYLTGTVLTNLSTPTVIDFGAGHSIYENPIMFLEIQKLLKKFKNVVLLIPSTNIEESLAILNKRKGIESGSKLDYDNRHFITNHCNYDLATIIQYTKDKYPDEITNELLQRINIQMQSYNKFNKPKM